MGWGRKESCIIVCTESVNTLENKGGQTIFLFYNDAYLYQAVPTLETEIKEAVSRIPLLFFKFCFPIMVMTRETTPGGSAWAEFITGSLLEASGPCCNPLLWPHPWLMTSVQRQTYYMNSYTSTITARAEWLENGRGWGE